jgi:hypothetical protein
MARAKISAESLPANIEVGEEITSEMLADNGHSHHSTDDASIDRAA